MAENLLKNDVSEEEDWLEERGLKEGNWEEGHGFDEEDWFEEFRLKERNWRKLHRLDESWTEEHALEEEDWLEELGLKKGNWEAVHSLDKNWVQEHGFVFEKALKTKECVVEIVIIGDRNCGKTQLIESVFGDHPSLTVSNHESRDEYRIHLSENLSFHIWIYHVKDIEFVRQTYFRYKTVFLFCYAVDDPESLESLQEMWIPQFLQRHMIRMFCFVVGIERDMKTEPKAVNSLEQMIAVREKAAVLCRGLRSSRLIGCSLQVKNSMVNTFQSAFDAVYPWIPF